MHESDIAPDNSNAERADYGQLVLERRLCDALALFNPNLPNGDLNDACESGADATLIDIMTEKS